MPTPMRAMPPVPSPAPLPADGIGMATDNRRAIVLMVVSMCLFAIDDMLIKIAASIGDNPASVGQVLIVQGLVGGLVFGALMVRDGTRLTRDLMTDRIMLARTGGDILAASCIVSALTLMELSNASAILQVQPLVVTLGAAWFLRETVGWRRYGAVTIGLVGVLIVIRPGLDGFTWPSLLVLLGVAGLALRDLSTRMLPARHSTNAVVTFVSLAIVPPGVVLHLLFGQGWGMGWEPFVVLLAGAGFGVAGYWAITQAMRLGEVSAVAPFRYSRLVAAILLGVLVLGERPDAPMWIGSALIVGAGIYALRREAKVRAAD